MDTNALAMLIAALSAKSAAVVAPGPATTVYINPTLVAALITGAVAGLIALMAAVAAYFQMRTQAIASVETAKQMGLIHSAVNSRDTAQVDKINEMNLKFTEFVKTIAVLSEQLQQFRARESNDSRTLANARVQQSYQPVPAVVMGQAPVAPGLVPSVAPALVPAMVPAMVQGVAPEAAAGGGAKTIVTDKIVANQIVTPDNIDSEHPVIKQLLELLQKGQGTR